MSDPNEVLFQITRKHLNSGLRGYPVGTCWTSKVDPNEGVSYVGHPIAELAYLDPEAVVFLLHNKRIPGDAELTAFKADLAARATVDPRVLELLAQLPKDGHPMEWLCAGLLYLGMTGRSGDYAEDALNLVARSPELVAAIFRLRGGWGDPIPSRPELGLIENFVHMLGMPGADPARLVQLMRTFYVLHMDHGGGNLSTFTGKAVASGLADMYTAMAAAMGGLSGPRHGRANQDCLNFVRKVGSAEPADIERFLRDALANKELIFGFGHAVLRAEDPRATIQYALGEKICPDDPLFRTAAAMRGVAVEVLSENPKISNPYPNVDAVSGTLLNATGFTESDYYTVLFGLSRVVGISAQIVDERLKMRDGKGIPIYRCSFKAENQQR
ncbi:MAG: citrate synthase [Rickettsiales bacterium]|nr:citrate synthase [Rickettsiales bacterium]|tara:strand:+ start:836 stop:1990 length:1155 start_codon:yes stop_codon:yes gene_type:complete